MTGKLILKNEGGWKRTLPVWAASAVLTVVVALPLARRMPASLNGFTRGAVIAVLAYVLFRCGFSIFTAAFGAKSETYRTVNWTVTEDTLILGDTVIPRRSIRNVHCWPNRDTLGFSHPGWTVNIETEGKNQLLRSLTEGAPAEASIERLYELVEALGYSRNWKPL